MIFKDEPTDGRTNKGDYYGPYWVNLGSKMLNAANFLAMRAVALN